MNKQRLTTPYMWVVIALGAAGFVYSAANLPLARLDLRFALLAVLTIGVTSRMTVMIPRISGHISVSDTFIFLTMLLYGGEAAVLVATLEGLVSTLFFSRRSIYIRPVTIVFNAAMMGCATFVTAAALRVFFADVVPVAHGEFTARFVIALCVMALVQYVANSTLAAVHTSLKTNQPGWQTWSKYYLWASITYFAGACTAGIAAKIAEIAGFYALVATAPIIAIVYFTYRTYLENIEAMSEAAKAEAAAEARAEAAAAQAEQARRHVEELSHYIAEQDRIRQQYAQIEKLSALGELASGVAHDFNNTLAGILGRAQLLLGTKDPERIEAGLKLIIKTAKDGAKTIKRIQDFARQRRDHDFQPVSLDQLLLDVREITRPRWKSRAEADGVHINLALQLGSDNALVMGDESELREVLINMVFNAVDAMPEGGTLALATREVDGQIEVSVTDTGTGMSEEVRSRVFDPFFTTKGKAGMGLGLAVGYGIIRRHEGTVSVESEPGRGTTFRIKLPVVMGALAVEPSAELPPLKLVETTPNDTHVLVVDDEEHVRVLLKDILESEGYRVTLASGGREALALLGRETFDGVFTDLGMQGMSGWELAHAVRELDAQIPLAVVTGWGEVVGSSEQTAARVDWIVAKPFDTEQILGIAREISRRRDRTGDGEATAAA
jgi:signal transduction histidine kinase/CheY-like chemotaxis protein